MSGLLIRPPVEADRPQWQTLWLAYQSFYRVDLPAAVTGTDWQRFFDPAEPVHCLVAEQDGALVGLAHYLFHRGTWSVDPYCYLHDLFTAEAARGQGTGRKLIEAVYRAADAEGAGRVYWLTHETNSQAMRLYDQVAVKTGFRHYSRPAPAG